MPVAYPLATVSRTLLDQVVHVFTAGGHRFTGQLVRVSDDGQALRVRNQPGAGIPAIDFYVDLAQVVAISVKEN